MTTTPTSTTPLPYGNGDDHLAKLDALPAQDHEPIHELIRHIHDDFARFAQRIAELPSEYPIGMHRERALRELLSVRTEVCAAVALMEGDIDVLAAEMKAAHEANAGG